ncbi:MAG: hypothetical protein WC069_01465 [Candidatus Shapirobacteria bacterium]
MTKKVEKWKDLGIGDYKYLFFVGGELHVSTDSMEEHKDILTRSNRPLRDILIAGAYTSSKAGVVIDGGGSYSLGIGEQDCAVVGEFVSKLPDIKQRKISTI